MIPGFAIGHVTADRPGWLTGTTVVVPPLEGAVAGVDVRGGGPGTRETDLLHPTALVERVHAIMLTGGSAYGLAAADGVMSALEADGIGFPIGPEAGRIVPIVPAAVIFDLGRGGEFGNRPTAAFGATAYANRSTANPEQGSVGAGTGATCGGLKGGFGYAEQQLLSGESLAAAVVVNAAGSAVDPLTGSLYADRHHRLPTPSRAARTKLAALHSDGGPLNTTLGVVLTDATLTKAQASKVAAIAQDGLARAVNPVHTMLDGDTIFTLATGARPASANPREALQHFNWLLKAAADVFTDACLSALLAAESRAGHPGYREFVPAAH